jgi:hypothetical protein
MQRGYLAVSHRKRRSERLPYADAGSVGEKPGRAEVELLT